MLLFGSCEKEINLKVPHTASKLSVNGLQMVGDTIAVKVSITASIAERKKHPDLVVRTAVVKLYVDGTYKQDMSYDGITQAYRSAVVAEAGKRYMIKVSAANYPEVTAEAVAMAAVPISSISHAANARRSQEGNTQDEIVLSFDDPAAANDYYIIRVNNVDSITLQGKPYGGFCVNTIDASIETVTNDNIDINTCVQSDNIFMRDELFNGRQKQLKLYGDSHFFLPFPYMGDTLYPTVQLFRVSEAYFRYVKSHIVANDANGDPFSEPANVYSNVTNGYGVFAIVGLDVKEIR
jgi:hypothetical protein